MTELKNDVVCTYKMLLMNKQINSTYFMVNKFEHGMVICLDISLKRTTIDVCRKHTNTGQCVLISSHEYWPRKIAWVKALLCQASHIQLFQERLSYKVVKAYATKSKGIIGNVDQRLLDWSWRHFIITETKQHKHMFYAFPLRKTVNLNQGKPNYHYPWH